VLKTRPDNDITDGLGLPDPTLLGALAVTWIILYFSLRGGVGARARLLTSQPSSPIWSFSLFLLEDSLFLVLKKVLPSFSRQSGRS